MQLYRGKIKYLKSNQIFVFGSNNQGRHGLGSALFAKQKCGAIYGQSKGMQGRSYAIITKDLTKSIHPSIPKEYILEQIKEFYNFASNAQFDFVIAYSGTDTNLNGYSNQDMADMFSE
jgi:hypothetical protein